NPGWNDSAYDFTGVNALLNIPHTASSAIVRFFASGAGWQGGAPLVNGVGGGDESFGLDQITISINTADQVPEPGTLALLGLGLATLAARRRSAKA
ncbi:PEP-CTERM sorting domain-containing protein, partial [Accumulibacter sp.]|uniref:PEP-CTERM sorting domain-containing protein n=1 Tax=Accumulibacter sp. TaxID=2053492 RepID=UPI0025F39AC6